MGNGTLSDALEPASWEVPSTFPSAVKTTNPVGVPDPVTVAVRVTALRTRAGLGKAVRVTAGAEAVGCEVLTEMELEPGPLLLRKSVLIVGSSVPVKLAVRRCAPPATNEVLSAAMP